MIVTGGTTADCTQAQALIEGLSADYLMADKAYDTNALLEWCAANNEMVPLFRPVNSQIKMDQVYIQAAILIGCVFLS